MIYILLPVHNRREITHNFIDCLLSQTYKKYHLVLIDDGSIDGTSDMVKSRVKNLTVIYGLGSWWWAGSLQQGILLLKDRNVDDKDVIVFMNDDITFDVHFLQTAINILGDHDEFLLPQVINQQTGAIEESGVCADLRSLSFVTAASGNQINCLPTRGLFMRMSTLRKVGNFHPLILPHYLSDYEFTIRAHRMGIRLLTSPKLLLESDDMKTGFRELEGVSFLDFLSNYFSIKSASNPIFWSTFILLVSPKRNIPSNLMKIWLQSLRLITLRMVRGLLKNISSLR